MDQPFIFNTVTTGNPGSTLIARQFNVTNSQANELKTSSAVRRILEKIERKFRTSQSAEIGISRREMPRPLENRIFLDYLQKFLLGACKVQKEHIQ